MKALTLALLAVSALMSVPARALTPAEALQKIARPAALSFTGRRSLKVTRQNMAPLVTQVQISYSDRSNYKLSLLTEQWTPPR